MFQIRRIHDDLLPGDQQAIVEVEQIFRSQFPDAPASDIEHLTKKLRNPFHQRFRAILYVAENSRRHVTGFAILLHEPEIHFCYLDFLAIGSKLSGRGIGAALYEAVRSQAVALEAKGLFFECLPDDPAACENPTIRQLNSGRLRFYEQYGARPIMNTAYETPVPGGTADNVPHLVYDDLDTGKPPAKKFVQQVVAAILERKYGDICPADYVAHVVNSIKSDPVQMRPFRFLKSEPTAPKIRKPAPPTIAIAWNDKHEIHHIRERGYVESPVRIKAIWDQLQPTGRFEPMPIREYDRSLIEAVHDQALVDFLESACANAPAGKSVYPYVFPIRNPTRLPRDQSVHAGYYCIDTFTPIHRNAFLAAKRAVDTTLTMADAVLSGKRLAYSLVRPPGHHAERRVFGGFCYFNNAAIAANYFSRLGKVAILDIDYHHGNGQQDIFYARSDVLTVSLHGDPDFAYPYFTGFADECGIEEGIGYNLNIPLPEQQNGSQYRQALDLALERIREFAPRFLVVALGLDPAKGDPTGTWSLMASDFEANGRMIGKLQLPTLVVQEGGYRTRSIGVNTRNFFEGLSNAYRE